MDKFNLDIINHIFSFIYEPSSDDDCNCYITKKTHYHEISKYFEMKLPREKKYQTPVLYKKMVKYLGFNDDYCFCQKNATLAFSQIKRQVDSVIYKSTLNSPKVDDLHITVHCDPDMLKQIYIILRKCKKVIKQYYCCGGFGIQFFVTNSSVAT